MKRTIVCLLLGMGLVVGSTATEGWAYYGGDGTYQNPYRIATVEDLIELGQSPWDYGQHFVLIQDVDLSGYQFTQAVIAAPDDSGLWDLYGEGFSGTFNGNGHVISGLQITGNEKVGLFGILESCAVVTQLGVLDADVSGEGENVGIIVGRNSGTVSRCFSSGTVQGDSVVGGIVGLSYGCIEDCYSSASVSGLDQVGGIVGRARYYNSGDSHVLHCYSVGIVDGSENYGGLVGLQSGGEAQSSFWDAEVSGIPGDQGLSTEQMMDANTFILAGWDCVGESDNGMYDVWLMPEGGGYPLLSISEGMSSPWPADSGVNLGLYTLPEDPNEVVWDAAERFSSQWYLVSLVDSVLNPDLTPDPNILESAISIEIEGSVEDVASDSLIGIDLENVVVCQAFDEDGNSVDLQNVVGPFEPWHPWVLMPTGVQSFALNLQLAETQSIPTDLSQVDFLFDGLYADPLVIVELPFDPLSEYVEIAAGFETQITTAQINNGTCSFTIHVQIDQGSLGFNILQENTQITEAGTSYSRRVGYDPEDYDYLINIDLIDSAGEVVERTSGSTGTSQGGGSLRYSGNWYNCPDVQYIRYTIAVDPDRRIVPLTLYDLPIVTD